MNPERRLASLVLYGLLFVLGVGGVLWFFDHFERRTTQIPVGYSAEARRNPWLALERYLMRGGIQVESLAGRAPLSDFPPTTDTLVVRGLGPLNATRRAALRRWMEEGGHLVVEVRRLWDEDARPRDDLLADFGIRLQVESDEKRLQEGLDVSAFEIPVPDVPRPLMVAFDPRYHLAAEGEAPGDLTVGGRLRLVERPVGAGRLTVVSDSGFMTNAEIGHQDHAFFAARLVAPTPGGKVWLIYDSAVPWLGALIWSAAPQAVISVGVLLLVWLWSLGVRLGPLRSESHARQRDLLEHLDASGDFLWRQGRAAHLVETSRRRILAAWVRRHPHLEHSDRNAQADAIAESTGWSAERVSRALFTRAEDAAGFVEQARLLQSLWRRAGSGRGRPARRASSNHRR